jgi:spore maturation protein CgeB
MSTRILVVGNSQPIHLGAHLLQAASALGLESELCDVNAAFAAPWPIAKFNWRMRGHRPPYLADFSRRVVERCRAYRPDLLLTTGLAPLDRQSLAAIGRMGILRVNYLTDDPWNRAHYAPWFMQALPVYDNVFSPRRANLADLQQTGCRNVAYLPFGYNPALHFVERPLNAEEHARFACDLVFAGGADRDRTPLIKTLVQAGFHIALYGGYWERYTATRSCSRGHAGPTSLRKAISGARVALCLVRRANRDGHVMRSFEAPAMGGCLLVEDTAEHRALFGDDGEAVVYFRTREEMAPKLRWLLDHPDERARLAAAACQRIMEGGHTYVDRLALILTTVRAGTPS